jgi:hypothetical protein
VRSGRLILAALVLLVASVPGILNVLAKDHVSTAEGVVAWLSAAVFVASALALLVLLATKTYSRLSSPNGSRSKPP